MNDSTTTMVLNKKLRNYSTYPVEQTAYEAMQHSAFAVAEALMAQPRGAHAEILGSFWWVSPVNGELEIVSSPDSDYSVPVDCNIFMVSDFDGQSASEMDNLRTALDTWLETPAFIFGNQDLMDAAVKFWYSN